MIRITSKKAGFRRCGIEHAATPTEYPNDRFTAEEIEILKAEPMLVVTVLPDSAAAGDNQGKRKAEEVIAAIAAAETAEAVDALVEGDARKGVLAAADKRKTELAK
jgi:hypothetical protein